MNSQNKKTANVCALLCLVFGAASFRFVFMIWPSVLLIIASFVCGIAAFAKKTEKTALAIVGMVLDIICIVVGIILIRFLLPILIAWLSVFGKGSSGQINEANLSPTGTCQIDEVNESYGATGGGSYLAIERAGDNTGFACKDDDLPKSAEKIEESRASWDTEYDITWVSDDRFYALLNRYGKCRFDLIRVDLDEDGYTAFRGSVKVDEDESYFDSYEIVDDMVYITCYLKLVNDFDEPVSFTIDASAGADYGHLLKDSHIVAVDQDGADAVFTLEAGESALTEVVFCGVHWASDEKADDEIPMRIELDSVTYDPEP